MKKSFITSGPGYEIGASVDLTLRTCFTWVALVNSLRLKV